jgi:hypothetical protein
VGRKKWGKLVQWRTPITLAVLFVILLGAAYYGWQTVVDPVTESGATTTPSTNVPTTPDQKCIQKKTYPRGTLVRAVSFKVNVFNAGPVSGRAGDVLSELHSKGFRLGVAANPPASVSASNVTILTSTPSSPRVSLVKEQFRGTVRLVPGPKLAIGVDIVIGPKYAGLSPRAPTSLTLKQATTVCTEFATKSAGHH